MTYTATPSGRGTEKVKRFAAVKGRHTKVMAEAGETFKRWEDLNNGDFKVGLNAMIEQNMKDHGLKWPPRVDLYEEIESYPAVHDDDHMDALAFALKPKRKLGLMGWACISMLVGCGAVLLLALIAAFQH